MNMRALLAQVDWVRRRHEGIGLGPRKWCLCSPGTLVVAPCSVSAAATDSLLAR
jgi:hypothetical protein